MHSDYCKEAGVLCTCVCHTASVREGAEKMNFTKFLNDVIGKWNSGQLATKISDG